MRRAELRGEREAEGSKGNRGEDGNRKGHGMGEERLRGNGRKLREAEPWAAGGEVGEEPLRDSAGRGWLGAWTEERG